MTGGWSLRIEVLNSTSAFLCGRSILKNLLSPSRSVNRSAAMIDIRTQQIWRRALHVAGEHCDPASSTSASWHLHLVWSIGIIIRGMKNWKGLGTTKQTCFLDVLGCSWILGFLDQKAIWKTRWIKMNPQPFDPCRGKPSSESPDHRWSLLWPGWKVVAPLPLSHWPGYNFHGRYQATTFMGIDGNNIE
jgi:hypothetical protein